MSTAQSLYRAVISAALVLSAVSAAAADFPAGPVRIVVPFSPGGSTDIVARHLAKRLGSTISQTVVVENISAGGTVVGMQSVANAPPDGNSLLITGSGSFTVMKHTNRNMTFDPTTALTPVTLINTLPHWIVVKVDRPEKNFAEFVEMIRKNPGKVSISVNAFGGAAHLGLASWAKDNGLDIAIIPYRGSSAAMIDLMGGTTTAHVDVVGSSMSFVTGGKAKTLSLLQQTALADYPKFPVAPAKDKAGLFVRGDHVLAVRSGTPPAIVNRIHDEFRKIMAEPEFLELLRGFGYEPLAISPADTKTLLERESERYREIVVATKISID
jgi:tripartite-type tricarboxylate transporter receptor subunit TctC